ncbi:photolyase/cryptochrome [Klebsormidium nitens]|uniref:Photolyase/cryptochrome n=1 Tax=Klebsormidium nitens TaxID=105231 RepID=A0A1Y1ILM6_KLENI|nr:photolyase/cryptochrome [Klebsormidium nitens]|eukprot:GAQ91785.1 photolyase/cryptochrome [Klebsormidium nitens]
MSSLMWFRKGLRLHDNPALLAAIEGAKHVYPVFILDPYFLRPDPTAPSPGSTRVGINRIQFLLQSLQDLDQGLQARGSRLLLVHGDPVEIIPSMITQWRVNRLCFERDTEPYAKERDARVKELAAELGIKELVTPSTHTLFDPDETIARNKGHVPTSYGQFCKAIGTPAEPLEAPTSIPGPDPEKKGIPTISVPTLTELGYGESDQEFLQQIVKGGETEALARLEVMMAKTDWVAKFEKPKTDPSAFAEPATTVLSPYLKFGCLSPRLFYSKLMAIYQKKTGHSKPPQSLEGQLLWREFFYTVGHATPRFDCMVGNSLCKQVPWTDDDALLAAWRDAKTGYPWIDAIMTQLRQQGWMHHLARHAVACFLTRGDLFVYWEKGRDVFDRLLIDGDWSINNGNWLWLSASAFFSQYFRIYSPITFGQKYDKSGKYIRRFLPVLKDFPAQYIYEPWKAPLDVQKAAKCVIGVDYPGPIVDHAEASKQCKERMAAAYALAKQSTDLPSQEAVEELRRTVNPGGVKRKEQYGAAGSMAPAGKKSKGDIRKYLKK